MRWQTHWRITIRWDEARNSPVESVTWQRECSTPAELRHLIDRARADPHVVAFPYEQVRALVGDEPQQCPAGHSYHGGSATRPVRDWRPCPCGGHLVIRCGCGDVTVEPSDSDQCGGG